MPLFCIFQQAQFGPIQLQLVPAASAQQTQQLQPQVVPIQLQAQPLGQQHAPQQVQIAQQAQLVKLNNSEPCVLDIKKSRVKSAGGERVPCRVCNKTVSCTATLRDHMRTHTGERPFKCSECNLSFSQRSNLRMHKRLHTGERPYMCGICGKTFARSSHLPAHMRTHTGEKPYKCEECNHSFITAQQLKNHHRVHTGEKPWKCDLCNAAFTHSSSLSTHKKKHTGNKPYECEKCSKKFFFSSALEKHLKVHSKNRPFKCPNCDNTFKYKESLTVHRDKYCGRHPEKKQRVPRKPDARKPGPKPGTGRRYVQQKKGRPRGRPRKKSKWTVKKGKKKVEPTDSLDDGTSENAGIKNETVDKFQDPLFSSSPQEDSNEDIPVAELKVESIDGSNEARVVMSNTIPATTSSQPESITPNNSAQNTQMMAHPNILHMDHSTSGLTIVPPEEAEKYMAGGMQVLALRSDMIQYVEGNHQILNVEQVQQLQQHLQQQQQMQQQQQQHIQVQHLQTPQAVGSHEGVQQSHEGVQQAGVQQQLSVQHVQQTPNVAANSAQMLVEYKCKDGVQVFYPR